MTYIFYRIRLSPLFLGRFVFLFGSVISDFGSGIVPNIDRYSSVPNWPNLHNLTRIFGKRRSAFHRIFLVFIGFRVPRSVRGRSRSVTFARSRSVKCEGTCTALERYRRFPLHEIQNRTTHCCAASVAIVATKTPSWSWLSDENGERWKAAAPSKHNGTKRGSRWRFARRPTQRKLCCLFVFFRASLFPPRLMCRRSPAVERGIKELCSEK